MTTHERWIIYPLLFLTLGIAMRDKVVPPRLSARDLEADLVRCNRLEVGLEKVALLEAGQVTCRVMTVAGPDGTDAVRMGVIPERGGRLEVCSRDGKTIVAAGSDQTGRAGVVETLDADGAPQVQLLSTPSGGVVTTVRHDKKIWVVTGHVGQNFGVFAEAPELGRRLPLTWPWKIEMKPKKHP